jgi:hypothetical protein
VKASVEKIAFSIVEKSDVVSRTNASRGALLDRLQFKTKFGVLIRRDYILIATNLLPFITNLSWSECIKQKGNPCGALEQLWYLVWHLDALFVQLAQSVDVWIGHGKDSVWDIFFKWVSKHHIRRWLLAYNLSFQGLKAIHNARIGHSLYI